MFNKIFKEPNRILKIASAVLVAVAVLSCLIWILVENANLVSIAGDSSMHEEVYNGLIQNTVINSIAFILVLLCIVLAFLWLKTILQKPGKTLKILIIIQAFILLGVLLIWCITETEEIIANSEKMVEAACYALKGNPSSAVQTQVVNTIVEIRNNEAELLITHILTVAICLIGVFVGSVLLYGIVDGCGRIVGSLERIADNSGKIKSQEQNTEMQEDADCHTSVSTGSQ